jgi:pyruvate dehydrogenase E2 component (dihydrolipoamide acetyltransferase)
MAESQFTIPHATSFDEVEISRLIEIRNETKDMLAEQGIRLTYMPFFAKAVVHALKKHPKLNCRLDMQQNRVIYNKFYNIGFATDTPDGLVVPVIRDADKKGIGELAIELADKSERARERRLTLEELRDSTFSITNYGSISGIHGVPIINYPNVAILGVGQIQRKPVVKGDQIIPGNVLPLSLAIDHRIVDGADAARFMRDLKSLLADPVAMLLL